MIERLPCVPDDRGASCPDIPDAISFRNVARERARDSEQAAFDDLLQAFWRGEFEHRSQPDGKFESQVFTLEAPRGKSRDHLYSVTHDGHVLKKLMDEATGRERHVATSERQPLFWTRQEFLRFVARFWDESASTRLANFETQEEALRFMATCSVEDYPAIPRTLLERLHISRKALENAARVACPGDAARKPRRRKSAESRRWGASGLVETFGCG